MWHSGLYNLFVLFFLIENAFIFVILLIYLKFPFMNGSHLMRLKPFVKDFLFSRVNIFFKHTTVKYSFISIIIVVLVLLYFNIQLNGIKQRISSIEAVDRISIELSSVHLILEELIIGDQSYTIDDLSERFKKIDKNFDKLNKAHCLIKDRTTLNDSSSLIITFDKIFEDYQALKALTYKRYKNYIHSKAGTKMDQEYDRLFDNIINSFSTISIRFNSCLNNELNKEQTSKIAVSIVFVLIFIYLNTILIRNEGKQNHLITEVVEKNKSLELIKLDLETKNKELNIAREELLDQNDLLLSNKAELAQQNATLLSLNVQMELSRSELSEALKKAMDSEEKYSKLFYHMNEGVVINEIVYDEKNNPINIRILDVNPAYEKILGFKKEDIIGKFTGEVYNSPEPPYFERFVNVVKTSQPVYFEDYYRPMDKYFRVSAFSPEENILAIVFNDITENKNLEIALQEERNNLEYTVNQRTIELNNSLKDLEKTNLYLQEANKHKTRFLSNMSHELRTPLNAIIGFTDLIDKQYYGEINQKQKEYLQLISNSANHLLSLINDILDISKIDSGSLTLEIDTVDLVETIREVVKLMNYLFDNKKVLLDFKTACKNVYIQADSRKIKQILINILTNALKFTPEEGRVDITLEIIDLYASIKIKDTGIGMDESKLDIIFDEFVQLEEVTDKVLGGAGIGLPLTKRLVELHNGQIIVQSIKGEGSEFIITFLLKNTLE